jgi:hypothetical protein
MFAELLAHPGVEEVVELFAERGSDEGFALVSWVSTSTRAQAHQT